MEYDPIEKVEKFIASLPQTEGWDVSVYTWPDTKTYGIRVAEVSLVKGNIGASWMQSDKDGGTVCFYAERLAIEYLNGEVGEDAENEIADAKANLLYAMYGVYES